MAKSKYEYTKLFEQSDILLPSTWIVVRIDGHGFHKFSAHYNFEKPNDPRALKLMNHAAQHVLAQLQDVTLAYGESDEYSFLFRSSTVLYDRRASKLVTTVVSMFTAAYVAGWSQYMGDDVILDMLPSFDGRTVLYPSIETVRDYFSWRQADCHINNLYNTAFWALVQQGKQSEKEAEMTLNGTMSSDKNEILFSRFNINYAKLPEMYRKGSVIVHDPESYEVKRPSGAVVTRTKKVLKVHHCDIIKSKFWSERPWILEP